MGLIVLDHLQGSMVIRPGVTEVTVITVFELSANFHEFCPKRGGIAVIDEAMRSGMALGLSRRMLDRTPVLLSARSNFHCIRSKAVKVAAIITVQSFE
jgi:hypothetical protein